MLVEEIRRRHRDRLGIKAKCRRDYGLSDMWTSLGFVPRGEVRSRGRDGEPLDGWWLDHGQLDLFAGMESEALLVVDVDHGVFADLRGRAPTGEAAESQTLEVGWLTVLVEVTSTPQLLYEIRDIADTAECKHQRTASQWLRHLTLGAEVVGARIRELMQTVRSAALANGVPSDLELLRALQYVAETSCAGLQMLVTGDSVLLQLTDAAWYVAGVKV
ncbi:PIN domain-containing protein [Streptomyces noursei]|uniref:hypothetical protein n=1 Tax=Streptomyces noursei TaxID=1971 RepID=UPI00382C1C92